MSNQINVVDEVVWAEGIFLSQQHFQLAQQQIKRRQEGHRQVQMPLAWGFSELEIDDSELPNGKLRINRCQGMLDSGDLFHQRNEILSMNIEGDVKEIYLSFVTGLPKVNLDGYQQIAETDSEIKRPMVDDVFDHERTREVVVLSPRLLLTTNKSNNSNKGWIKIAELEKQGNEYHLKSDFIPAVTRIGVSKYLSQQLTTLRDLVQNNIRVLRQRRAKAGRSAVEFGHSNLEHSLLLQALMATYAELQHCYKHRVLHPERLFEILNRIKGRLEALSLRSEWGVVPDYNHASLINSFRPLFDDISLLIEEVMPAHMESLVLHNEGNGNWVARNINETRLNNETFYLGVSLPRDDTAWADDFIHHVKVAAESQIAGIIASALPGVSITQETRPPSKLLTEPGYFYFALNRHSSDWQEIVNSKTIALFISDEFRDASIKILSI